MTIPKDAQSALKYRELLSQRAKGRVFSEEHRKKLSLAKLKNPVKYWQGKERREYYRKYYLANKEKKLANNKIWKVKNYYRAKDYLERQRTKRNLVLESKAGRPKPKHCEV